MHTVAFACKSSFFLEQTAKLVGSSLWKMNWVRHLYPSMLGVEMERTMECRWSFVGRMWTFLPSRAGGGVPSHYWCILEASGSLAGQRLSSSNIICLLNQSNLMSMNKEVPLFPYLLSLLWKHMEGSAPDVDWHKKAYSGGLADMARCSYCVDDGQSQTCFLSCLIVNPLPRLIWSHPFCGWGNWGLKS